MSNLSSFNIENLFSDKKNHEKPNFTGQLDIKTLFQNEDDKNYKFNSKVLLDSIYEKRDKLEKHYYNIYKKCCETIKSANKSSFTDINYEIPQFSEHIGYNCDECIDFLKKRLEEQKLDISRINSRTINISWGNLENKINNAKK
jgi:hypothetical protein